MGEIFGTFLINQFRFRLPVQPSRVKWTIRMTHDPIGQEAPLLQIFAGRHRAESGAVMHRHRSNITHGVVAHRKVKIGFHPFHEIITANIYQEFIASSLYAGE